MRVILERSLRDDIRLDLALPKGLWPVEADPSQLELALLNLAVNARDALSAGGHVRVEAQNCPGLEDGALVGDFVRLSVVDDGPGIPPDQAALVFEPFYTTKEVGKGTGLGLSQVYGFARGSGGDARIEPPAGRGAAISIYLPRTEKTPAVVVPADEPRPTPKASGRVLLVEDDQGVATMVSEMLRDLGFAVVHATGGASALAQLERDHQFDLVFSDMVMPGGMDGIELAHEVERRRPDLPILLTTGFSPAVAAAQREGRRLLPKPYGIQALSHAIGAALEGKGQAGC
jgi:CheY-like chemotaxis protein